MVPCLAKQIARRKETRYVYDGWTKRGSAEMAKPQASPSRQRGPRRRAPLGRRRSNIIAELDASKVQGATFATCARQIHVWGLDVSGATQGAGGIGGLLVTRDFEAGLFLSFPVYDGRGNVTGMLDESGRVAAAYEYGAYGELMRAVGAHRHSFHLGWSTKFTDDEARLINFGKRWYDPRHGRFVNRDPIGEADSFAATGQGRPGRGDRPRPLPRLQAAGRGVDRTRREKSAKLAERGDDHMRQPKIVLSLSREEGLFLLSYRQ